MCTTEPAFEAISAYLPIVKNRIKTNKMLAGIGLLDFSKVMGKNSEPQNECLLKGVKHDVPCTYFFYSKHLADLNTALSGCLPQDLVDNLTKTGSYNGILDYGWMRNMVYLLGIASGADAIQFFDLDTRPLKEYQNILETHAELLTNSDIVAASGNYFGPKPVVASMFKTKKAQIEFLMSLKKSTGFDTFNPPLVGGAMAVRADFFEKCPLPLLPETTMSDDLLISYLSERFKKKTQQSNELVEHNHAFNPEPRDFENPNVYTWIQNYFKRLRRIVALMDIFSELTIKNSISTGGVCKVPTYGIDDSQLLERMNTTVNNFVTELIKIAESEGNDTLVKLIGADESVSATICDEIYQGVNKYFELLHHWPTIIAEVKKRGPSWVSP